MSHLTATQGVWLFLAGAAVGALILAATVFVALLDLLRRCEP